MAVVGEEEVEGRRVTPSLSGFGGEPWSRKDVARTWPFGCELLRPQGDGEAPP